MDTLDRWALHQTAVLLNECTRAYDAYEYHRVYQLCSHFSSVTLSAVYHDILKDRLYTLGTNNPLRRSSQTAIYHIFHTLVKVLAPILTFTADEAWSFATAKTEFIKDSIHLQDWPVAPSEWTNPEIDADVSALLKIRTQVNEVIEPQRASGLIGKSLDAAVSLTGAPDDSAFKLLEKYRVGLPELFIVSYVELQPTAKNTPLATRVRPSSELGFSRCARCWRWLPALEGTLHGEICSRCAESLKPSV
jgi:isoleucyl-tRNA synthetase